MRAHVDSEFLRYTAEAPSNTIVGISLVQVVINTLNIVLVWKDGADELLALATEGAKSIPTTQRPKAGL